MKIHTAPPRCDPRYDQEGNVEYYVDCNDSKCANSSSFSAASVSPPPNK